jgi:predicted hydrocarbon binding protein
MHGLIFSELRKYVDGTLGEGRWHELVRAAGVPERIYMPIATYPDEEAAALVSAVARLAARSVERVLEDFGEFMAPDLLRMYSAQIPQDWHSLDIIENTEETIHRVVRAQSPGADPPRLRCLRRSPTEVLITYDSPRRLCAVAKGIARGIGRQRREPLSIIETRCMHKGAPACEIVVSALEATGAPSVR